MPLYEYRCTQCGHRFEKIQSFSAEPERECPKCYGPLVRPLTAPAFQFKGAGWYVNDYASKGSAQASDSAPDSKAAPSDGATKPADKSESKPSAPAAAPAASTPAPSSPASSSST